jgi:DNA polymerase delta subunit 1
MEVKLPTFAFEKRAEDEHVQFQVTSYNYEDHACKPFDESLHGVYENGGNYTSRQESLREESAPAVSVLQLFGRTKFNVSVCIHVEIWHSLVLQYPSNLQRWEFDGVTSYIANKLHYCMKEISFHLSMHHRLFDCPRRVDDSSQLQVFPFLHIRCKSKKVYNRVKALFWNFKMQAPIPILQGKKFHVVEEDIPLILRFMHSCHLRASGFFQISKKRLEVFTGRSHCQEEYVCVVNNLTPPFEPVDVVDLWPQRILSFDIESPSVVSDDVPDSDIPFCVASKDPIRCICSSIWDSYSNTVVSASHTFGYHDALEVANHFSFQYATEQEMLEGWRDFVVHTDPDWLTGWNTDKFDLEYMYARMKILDPRSRFFFFSRLICTECELQEINFSNKQKGSIDRSQLHVPGRIQFDLLPYWFTQFKLRSYTLKSVSEEEFPTHSKIDMSYGQMGRDFRSGNLQRIRAVIEYCVRDSELPIMLFRKHQVLPTMIEMSRTTCAFISDLVNHGQIFSVTGMLFLACKKRNFIMTHTSWIAKGYQGAKVLPTKRGFYPQPIVTLDFASLYPSIMLTHNLCFSTNVSTREVQTDSEMQTDIGTTFFRTDIPGILPDILTHLLSKRKQTRSELKTEADPTKKIILHCRQLALKICANSVYGFSGAPRNKNYCSELIAATVTARGRQLLEMTQKKICDVQAHLQVQVVAGDTDSVMLLYPTLTSSSEDLRRCFQYGKEASALISNGFIDLQVEKVILNAFFFCQKQYGGLEIKDVEDPGNVITKGGFDIKRNYAKYLSDVYKECYHGLIEGRITNEDDCLAIISKAIDDLMTGKVDISLLAITMKLGKYSEEQSSNLVQGIVTRKIKERGGNVPKPGDRISYVILSKPGVTSIGQKAEDLTYAKTHPALCKIDVSYYLECLARHLEELYEVRFGQSNRLREMLKQARCKLLKNITLASLMPAQQRNVAPKRVLGTMSNIRAANKVSKQRKLHF